MAVGRLLLSGRARLCGALCACIQSPAKLVCVEKGQGRTWMRHRHVYPTHLPIHDHSLVPSRPSLWQRRDLVAQTSLNCQSHSYHRALSQLRGGGRGLHTTACLCLLVKQLVTKENARVWVSSLSPNERNNLEWALHEVEPSETGMYEGGMGREGVQTLAGVGGGIASYPVCVGTRLEGGVESEGRRREADVMVVSDQCHFSVQMRKLPPGTNSNCVSCPQEQFSLPTSSQGGFPSLPDHFYPPSLHPPPSTPHTHTHSVLPISFAIYWVWVPGQLYHDYCCAFT